MQYYKGTVVVMIKSPYDMYVHDEHMHLYVNCLCHMLVDDQVPGTRLRFVEFTQGTITSLLTAAVMLKTHNYAMNIIFSFPSVSRPMYVCTAIFLLSSIEQMAVHRSR